MVQVILMLAYLISDVATLGVADTKAQTSGGRSHFRMVCGEPRTDRR